MLKEQAVNIFTDGFSGPKKFSGLSRNGPLDAQLCDLATSGVSVSRSWAWQRTKNEGFAVLLPPHSLSTTQTKLFTFEARPLVSQID